MPPKEKIEAVIRKISKSEGNKFCVDCNEKMPAYVNMTHNTFVCTRCSGLHRELQFKIKGISMSTFTQDDVAMLSSGGNSLFNSKFLATYNPSRDHPMPTISTDMGKLRDFISQKYTGKKWYSDHGEQGDFYVRCVLL